MRVILGDWWHVRHDSTTAPSVSRAASMMAASARQRPRINQDDRCPHSAETPPVSRGRLVCRGAVIRLSTSTGPAFRRTARSVRSFGNACSASLNPEIPVIQDDRSPRVQAHPPGQVGGDEGRRRCFVRSRTLGGRFFGFSCVGITLARPPWCRPGCRPAGDRQRQAEQVVGVDGDQRVEPSGRVAQTPQMRLPS